MSVKEERLTILRMVEEGKISPEQGAKLLAAISANEAKQGQKDVGDFDSSSSLRVSVTDSVTGQSKVNVNVPIGLVRFGLRFIPDSAHVDTEAILAALNSGYKGQIVDVVAEDDKKHVQVFID
jgi:SHOCT-like protein